MDNLKQKICPQCGRVFYVKKGRGEKYCPKHRKQREVYGKFLDNNPRCQSDPNEYWVEGNIVKVQTYTMDNLPKDIFTISLEDIDLIKKYKWASKEKTNGIYIVNDKLGYIHNVILPPKEGFTVDHIDRNPLNNTRENLRYANSSEQNFNQKKKDTTFDIKGIETRNSKYHAYIKITNKRDYSPYYPKYEQAVFARYLLEKLSPYKMVNGDMTQYINKLTEEEKQEVIQWFNNKYKDRIDKTSCITAKNINKKQNLQWKKELITVHSCQ